jgi:hypothetical protein
VSGIRFCSGVGLLLCAAAVAVRAAPPSVDALRAAADSDELELARVAARVGDDVVMAALVSSSDSLAQLAAIRAAPYLVDEAQALLPLAAIAASRDPELAPLAAGKLLRIAQDLVREGLARREVLASELGSARAALLSLLGDATARADIRLYAGQAAHLLGTLGVPESDRNAQHRR